jgi:hypothetical protein
VAVVNQFLLPPVEQDDWYFWVNMKNGQVTMPVFQNLEAFWPGVLTLVGDIEAALKSIHNYHQVEDFVPQLSLFVLARY